MTRPPTPPAPPTPPVIQPPQPVFPIQLSSAAFGDLQGWAESDPRAALLAFRRSCAVLLEKAADTGLGGVNYAGTAKDWGEACSSAAQTPAQSAQAVRALFEATFVPYRVNQGSPSGLFTGYYEPELKGSRTRHGAYQTPLYGVPADLVTVDLGLFRDTFKGQRLAGMVMNGRLVPYPARAEIVARGVNAHALFYVDDPFDAFFLQIQGSGRVVLDDGSIVRAAFAAQNGQPYTAIGAVLVQRGELMPEDVSLQAIRAWMMAHPRDAQGLMNANASYVFFSEQPIGDPGLGASGTEGVALTPEASIAVDTGIHPLGVPAWLETTVPNADPTRPDRDFDRLLIMQDTGGAIRGAVRADVYWGYGAAAGAIAGRMRSQGRLTVFLPKSAAAKLGPSAGFPGPR
jgi:membrane-bound lytic murein transglycosylase A